MRTRSMLGVLLLSFLVQVFGDVVVVCYETVHTLVNVTYDFGAAVDVVVVPANCCGLGRCFSGSFRIQRSLSV